VSNILSCLAHQNDLFGTYRGILRYFNLFEQNELFDTFDTLAAIERPGGTQIMKNHERLTTGDVMRYCHVSRSTVRRWIKSDKLIAYLHPDGQWRITQAAFVDFLRAYDIPIDEELERDKVRQGGSL
jgi:Helix-turn-helix domain